MKNIAEFAVEILKRYTKENSVLQRSTSDLSQLEQWLLVELIKETQKAAWADGHSDGYQNSDCRFEKPFVCPVCYGRGQVVMGFYSSYSGKYVTSSITDEQCRTCSGSGIVWRNKTEKH